MNKKVYEVSEIKEMLGIGINQAYELVKSGEFHVVNFNSRYLIPKESFDKWLLGKDAV